jgi:signal transduction histidine kinase
LLATGLVAVLFQPSRERLQLGVDRLFYGQRDDPLKALSQLGYRLEAAITPEMVLPTLVETIAQTLKLPYAAIKLLTVDGSITAAQVGVETEERLELQLVYRGETVGLLLAGQRGAGEPFSPTDRRILENLAHQAGPAVHSVQLTTELQNARMQLVTAREEERRRLRRDLHDGLGAALAALNLEAGVSAAHDTQAAGESRGDGRRAEKRHPHGNR